MYSTMDQAGRVVIPAAVRKRAGLQKGAKFEIIVDDDGIRLVQVASDPTLVKVGKGWLSQPTVPADERPTIDVAALIEAERNRWPL